MDRLHEEIVFHDHQAQERAQRLSATDLCFRDEDYLDHESWIRPAFAQLGEVRGLQVLDLGCGHGMAAVVLSRLGAKVTATDLSVGYLGEVSRRALVNAVDLAVVQADAERLPFADASFDRIWGNAILHHLDLPRAARELFRVLRPGGWAVCCEPWGENLLLEWARRRLPYPGKARTRDERPLREDQVSLLRGVFPSLEIQGHQLLSMARRVIGPGRVYQGLSWCDAQLLTHLPGLTRFCRYVVLKLPREV